MTAAERGVGGARENLARRVLWQPLGIGFSLWTRVVWIAPWFAALLPSGPEPRTPYPALILFAVAALAHLSAWLVTALDVPVLTASALRLVLLLAGVGSGLAVYVAVPIRSLTEVAAADARWQATWVVVLALGFAWWRGGRVSSGEALDPSSTLRNLFAGVLVAASAMVVFPAQAARGAAVFLPAYVGGGLAGVLFGQIHDASRRRGGRPLPFRMRWYAMLLLGVLAVVLSGVLAGMLLDSEAAWGGVSILARWIEGIAAFLGRLLEPLLSRLLRWLGPIFDAWVVWLQGLMQGAEPVAITPPAPLQLEGDEVAAPETVRRFMAGAGAVLRVLLGVAGVAALLWMAVRTTRRVRSETDDVAPDTVESLAASPAAGRGRGLGGSLRSALQIRNRARGLYHALIVRRVYAQLLEWAARDGRPRRPSETPLEFGVALALRRPDLRLDLEPITQAYLQVRYAERPESREMVDAVLACWDRVRRSHSGAGPMGVENSR